MKQVFIGFRVGGAGSTLLGGVLMLAVEAVCCRKPPSLEFGSGDMLGMGKFLDGPS